MFKVGDMVQFGPDGHPGEVLLVSDDSLLLRVEQGTGRVLNMMVASSEVLGWQRDETHSCWFVGKKFATVVKSKPSFKGNIK